MVAKNPQLSKGIDYPLPKKMIMGMLIVLLQVTVIITGVQIITSVFRRTTDKLITEYHELHALQNMKMSLGKIVVAVNGLEINYNLEAEKELVKIYLESREHLDTAMLVLTAYHSLEYLDEPELILKNIETSVCGITLLGKKYDKVFESIMGQSREGIDRIDTLIEETKTEIGEQERKSRMAIVHRSFTIGAFGVMLLIVTFWGGIWYIRKLTKPVKQLVEASILVGSGEKNVRVSVESHDEFKILADSFNEMMNNLEKTTVSEEYLRSIVSKEGFKLK